MVNGQGGIIMSKGRGFFKRAWRIFRIYFLIAGIVSSLFLAWIVAGWPFYFDRWLIVSERPFEAEAIVCIPGGFSGNNLPTQDGWQRVYTAVQLYFDGFASRVIFTGGGSGKISEGEVYAEVAQWLGLPEKAVVINPHSGSTAEHPYNILKLESLLIKKDTPLILVTSSLHSRRTSMCFKKQGFTDFSMVTGYSAKGGGTETVRSQKTSEFKEYKPVKKRYNDVFRRIQRRTGWFVEAMREYGAIFYYKIKGEA
jgi:uncharacterized SAM-binding protein YcdF (DUF218 family)